LNCSIISWPSEPGPGDEKVSGVCRPRDAQRRIGDQHESVGADHGDVGKILDRIIADIGIDRRAGDVRPGAADHQRIAVGRGAGGERGADGAARAGMVLDIKLLAERFRQLLGDQPAELIGAAARREGDDDLYGTRGPVLRGCRSGRRGDQSRRS
jgi:hypothetical protein